MRDPHLGRVAAPLWDRRAVMAAGLAGALVGLTSRRARASTLTADPGKRLDLPDGFTYRVLQRVGDKMSDGHLVPSNPDGMGCFALANGQWALMRNHEIFEQPEGTVVAGDPRRPKEAYDKRGLGGVTRVVVDPSDAGVLSSNLVLCGTMANCSGGPSPWGWLSCEEDFTKGHGYVFLCDPEASGVRPSERLDCYGRFQHEAVAIDPATSTAWLTEDQHDSALYRFLPNRPETPFEGRLQALVVDGHMGFDTGTLVPGVTVLTNWVDVSTPLPKADTVRLTARSAGAAIVRRGEGCAWHDHMLYVAATAGGPNGTGQILRLNTATGALECVAVSTDLERLEMPDNLAIAPFGTLFVAEDGKDGHNWLRALTPDGRLLDVACNVGSAGEFCGVCLSPDGTTLFVNLQEDGETVAIRGPFRERFA